MWRQASHDLETGKRLALAEDWDWACVAAQQAAEKAIKAVLLFAGLRAAPDHNLNRLFDGLVGGGVATPALKAELQRHLSFLTLAFGFSRYPTAELATAPADLVTREQADEAMVGAKAVFSACLRLAPELAA